MKTTRFQILLASFSIMLFLLAAACTKEPATSSPKPQTEDAKPSASAGTPPPTGSPANSPGSADTSSDLEEAARAKVAAKWTGDLDGMIQRRMIRVLTVYSKTNYFVDRGTQRGLTYEAFQLFEDDLNKKLKNKNVRVHVAMVPVANDDLIPALLEGRGDVVAAGKLISEWRRERVDFTNPTKSHVSSVVVTSPGGPPITTGNYVGVK